MPNILAALYTSAHSAVFLWIRQADPRRGRAAVTRRLLRGARPRRAVPDPRAADCRPRRWRSTVQPCHEADIRTGESAMGNLDRPEARQPPVSALLVRLAAPS